MIEWLIENVETLTGYPLLQGILAALATFILEDPTTIACGLLVADGRMGFMTALIGVSLGIAIGDVGLYGIGRAIGPRTIDWGLVSPQLMERAKRLFDRNLILAVVLSRFLPGMRLPTYMGAGFLGASPIRFMAVALVASLVWTFLLLSATLKFGETVLPLLGDLKWPVAISLLIILVLVQRYALSRTQINSVQETGKEPVVSAFEFWPPALFYVPVLVHYGWLAIRFRSLTLPTVANPSIFSSGMVGEKKSDILDLVSSSCRKVICRYDTLEKDPDLSINQLYQEGLQLLRVNQLDFPLVAKPDIGQRGSGVQMLKDESDLRNYLREFPAGYSILFQELCDLPLEAGILYYRLPFAEQGSIFSITLKQFPRIVGDGEKTVTELIMNDERAAYCAKVYLNRHRLIAEKVLLEGESLPLVFAGNHCQGAIFKDGTDLASDNLLKKVHDIFASMPEFYFGRLDVKFESLETLLKDAQFKIIEINGAGSEATHIWDSRMTLLQAYRVLFKQFRILFEIGDQNRQRGFRTLGPIQLLKEFRRFLELNRTYPETS